MNERYTNVTRSCDIWPVQVWLYLFVAPGKFVKNQFLFTIRTWTFNWLLRVLTSSLWSELILILLLFLFLHPSFICVLDIDLDTIFIKGNLVKFNDSTFKEDVFELHRLISDIDIVGSDVPTGSKHWDFSMKHVRTSSSSSSQHHSSMVLSWHSSWM